MEKRIHINAFKSCLFNGSDEKGFTLLETMTALLVTSLTVLLLSFAVQHFQTIDRMHLHSQQQEWHIFLNQLEYDLEGAVFENHSVNALSVWRPMPNNRKEHHLYERTNGKIAKKLKGGHEPMLMNVAAARFQREGQGVRLTVTFTNEESYSAWIDLREQMGRMQDE